MGNPVFKFTLTHSASGTSKIISEPLGWKECILKLERHPDFHSLIEYFEGPSGGFTFYGNNGVIDGGCEYIKNIEKTYGFNTKLQILVHLSFNDGASYDTVFSGILSLGHLKEFPDNKVSVPILPDTMWTKFISRMDTPVNIGSLTDLDGNAVAPATEITINLTSQTVRHKFKRTSGYNADNEGLFTTDSETVPAGSDGYLIFDNSRNDLDEIDERFEYGTQISLLDPTTVEKYLFKAKYGGSYRVQASIRYSLTFSSSVNVTSVQFYLKYKNPNGSLISHAIGTATSATGVTTHTTGLTTKDIDQTITLIPGGEVYIYGVMTLSDGRDVTYAPDFDSDTGAGFSDVYTTLEITADTTYPDSTATGYTVYDALQAVLIRYGLGTNPFFSNYFNLSSSGCASKFVLCKGLQLRGYTLTEKPFFISFKELWNGLNPIFNLGLGLETIAGVERIRIEEKAHFYDSRTASVQISNVIPTREYDDKKIFKEINIGYSQWKSESISGIDDPQTKHTYASEIAPFGTELTLYSTFVAASLAIENLRREPKEKKSRDNKFDDNTFIIAVSNTSSPFNPELSSNYEGVTNLLNSSTRYNIILTPKRNLYRWANYFLGGFQKYLTGRLRFVSGEGNLDCISDLLDRTNMCLGITEFADENGDFYLTGFSSPTGVTNPGNPYLHLPDSHSYQTKLNWEDYQTIRNNKKTAISISQTNSNFKKLFIETIGFTICDGQADTKAWAYEPFDLVVPESNQPTRVC